MNGVHLSHGLNELKENARQNVVNGLRRLTRYAGECVGIMELFRLVEKLGVEDQEVIDERDERFKMLKRKVTKWLGNIVKGLQWVDGRIEWLIKNLLEGFSMCGSLASEGPKHARRKLEFIKAVLLRIQADVCDFRRKVEEIEGDWKGASEMEPEEWFKKIEPSLGLFKDWNGQVQKGMCDFANRAGRDRGCKRCRR